MTNKRHDKVDMSSRRGVYRCTGRQRGRREIEEEKGFRGASGEERGKERQCMREVALQ